MTNPTTLTRPHWATPDADLDIHLEEHLGIVDSTFQVSSKLAGIMNIRSLRGTNQIRLDRMGANVVRGRKAGEPLVRTRVPNDKLNLTVDTVLYTRNEIDMFDDWTSSLDARKELAESAGTELAKLFDQAALIQAQKCGDFVVPTGLEGSFHNGIVTPVTVSDLPENLEAAADALVRAHRKSLEQLILRDLGDALYSEGITFIDPLIFSILLEHKRITNVEFQGGGAINDLVRARIGMLNGVRVMETPRLATQAIPAHPLGSAFHLTDAQALRRIVTLIPSKTLIAAQVHAVDANYWRDDENFSHVLDTYQSYTIGQRRPDACASVAVTIDNTP